jgi:hypothetical protein
MSNWKQKLQESGLTEAQLNEGTQEAIAEYNEVASELKAARYELSKTDDEDDRNSIQSDIKEFEKGLEKADAIICKRISSTVSKKESMRKLGQSRKKNVDSPKEEQPKQQKKEEGGKIEQKEEKIEKKSNSFGWLIGGIAAVGLGILGFNLLKNRK